MPNEVPGEREGDFLEERASELTWAEWTRNAHWRCSKGAGKRQVSEDTEMDEESIGFIYGDASIHLLRNTDYVVK